MSPRNHRARRAGGMVHVVIDARTGLYLRRAEQLERLAYDAANDARPMVRKYGPAFDEPVRMGAITVDMLHESTPGIEVAP